LRRSARTPHLAVSYVRLFPSSPMVMRWPCG
jgi:hypothetical protein